MNTSLRSISVLLALIALGGGTAQAVVVGTASNGPAVDTTLSANLATSATITQTGFTNTYGWGTGTTTQIQVLKNLLVTSPASTEAYTSSQGVLDEYNSYAITFTLDTGVNVGGYSIESVDTYACRGTEGDRAAQTYSLYYSVVGDASFVLLGSFSSPSNSNGSKIHIADNIGGSIASGVDALQFNINGPTVPFPGTVYSEVAIYGAAVPEPASIMLLGAFGALFALRRVRGKTA